MKALLTGGSSFSGIWFARSLAKRGFEVVATLRKNVGDYSDVRGERARELQKVAEVVPGAVFGTPTFFDLVEKSGCDVLCHHAAHVADYRSPDFDVAEALRANTLGFRSLSERLKQRGCRAVIVTGSAFEPGEGAGEVPLKAFSPYGLSKAFTVEFIRYWCDLAGLPLGKFVIANPFGPLEEPRFCAYLMKSWAQGQTPEVRTPDYVRDNIHADALGEAYAAFVAQVVDSGRSAKLAPTMYVETQGAFAGQFAREVERRIGKPCPLKLGVQTDFSEPLVRINTDRVDLAGLGWNETAAWDSVADYYLARLAFR